MGWNDTTGAGSGRGQDHISIKANQTIRIHALLKQGEEPISYWSHFIRGKGSVICPGREQCPVCQEGTIKAKKSHAMNVYDYESGAVKILEQGNSIYQQIKMVFDQYGSLDGVDLSIKRVGDGLNTQYLVMPLPLTAPFAVQELKLFDLDTIKIPDSKGRISEMLSGATPEPATTTTIPPNVGLVTPTFNGPITTPPPAQTAGPMKITFGKYVGLTIPEIAAKDMNYVKWIAKNVTDVIVKKEADNYILQQIGTSESVTPSHTAPPSTPPVANMSSKLPLVNEAYAIINGDKYKGNMNAVIGFMKQATQTPQNPNGKMLLADYSVEELQAVIKIMKEDK